MTLAPIILFCYNSPWHVEQTLIALSKNELANQSVSYIYCDGPKENATEELLNRLHRYPLFKKLVCLIERCLFKW